ncbi:hypothetical protein, partial [Brumicola pallidula]
MQVAPDGEFIIAWCKWHQRLILERVMQVAPDGEFIIAWCESHQRLILERLVQVAPQNEIRTRGAGCTR